MADRPVLIFIHVPKTAGSTLFYTMARQYPRGSVLRNLRDPDLPGVPPERWATVQCITGHIQFGVHRYLGDRPYVYITMLRDPIERMISWYYHVLRDQTHPFHQSLVDGGYSLLETIQQDLPDQIINLQTAMLASISSETVMTSAHLESAKGILVDHILGVGLSERVDETLLLFQRLLGWPNVFYFKRNVTANRPKRDQVDAAAVRLLEQQNELDMDLYRFASKRFAEQVHFISPLGLAVYRGANRVYGMSSKSKNWLRRRLKERPAFSED